MLYLMLYFTLVLVLYFRLDEFIEGHEGSPASQLFAGAVEHYLQDTGTKQVGWVRSKGNFMASILSQVCDSLDSDQQSFQPHM